MSIKVCIFAFLISKASIEIDLVLIWTVFKTKSLFLVVQYLKMSLVWMWPAGCIVCNLTLSLHMVAVALCKKKNTVTK